MIMGLIINSNSTRPMFPKTELREGLGRNVIDFHYTRTARHLKDVSRFTHFYIALRSHCNGFTPSRI